jgi:hypothetical protein
MDTDMFVVVRHPRVNSMGSTRDAFYTAANHTAKRQAPTAVPDPGQQVPPAEFHRRRSPSQRGSLSLAEMAALAMAEPPASNYISPPFLDPGSGPNQRPIPAIATASHEFYALTIFAN